MEKMELDFTFKNEGEAEAFAEVALTYPNLGAVVDTDGEQVLITVDNGPILVVLCELVNAMNAGPAKGRYRMK